MSIQKNKELLNFGARLAQERKRLGYTQSVLADLLGKSSVTQFKYESGETEPDSSYFFALDKLGADIFYIITGRQLEALNEMDEIRLLSNFRSFDDPHKRIILNLLEDIVRNDVSTHKVSTSQNRK